EAEPGWIRGRSWVAIRTGLSLAASRAGGSPAEVGPGAPPGSSSQVRIVRANCNATSCAVQCDNDEELLIAYRGRLPVVVTLVRATIVSTGGNVVAIP